MMTQGGFRAMFRTLLFQAKEAGMSGPQICTMIDDEICDVYRQGPLPKSTHPLLDEITPVDQITDAIVEAGRLVAYAVMRAEMSPQTIQHELDRVINRKEK